MVSLYFPNFLEDIYKEAFAIIVKLALQNSKGYFGKLRFIRDRRDLLIPELWL